MSKPSKQPHYIREWMEHRGIKQKDIVENVGVDKATASRWLKGTSPQKDKIEALAAYLEIEVASLFRHPNDDWLARFFQDKKQEEVDRAIEVLKALFPDMKKPEDEKTGTED